jgi:hypothetical protein
MSNEQELLDEIQRLITEQNRSLSGGLSDEHAARCRERSKRIAELLEMVKSHRAGRAAAAH